MVLLEIRFHGRGGQGIVVGSGILGMAYFFRGDQVQFFPEFGGERRGAPVQAVLRISDTKIKAHYNIYQPDHVILFDNSIMNTVNVLEGLKPGGWVLINSRRRPDEFSIGREYRVATIDADAISLENRLGNAASPIINAAVAGAFARVIGSLPIDIVIRSVKESVPAKIEENIKSAITAYERVMIG